MRFGGEDLKMKLDNDANIPIMTAIDFGNAPLSQELLKGEHVEDQLKANKVFDPFIYFAV